MCWLSKLFKKKVTPIETPILTLPHPEELPDFSQTFENVSIDKVLTRWLTDWEVPQEYWDYWRTAIAITVKTHIPYAAQTWSDGVRHLDVIPAWLNCGVIAHEQAHNSYALLTDDEKAAFSLAYTPLKDIDPLIKLLYSINDYGLTNDVEAHAELYRYLSPQIPEVLKPFYPRLF